ncbi:MAG: hypothetical protein B6D71_10715 [gamma proteobacterium symbiont of Stewartia floridana]|nr:MAG: hypothetical protein B6D71_10715 [gamma proteobacterium symbiont of Stewartia floridana]
MIAVVWWLLMYAKNREWWPMAFIQNAYPMRVGCHAENLSKESQEQESMLDETVSAFDICAKRIKG